MSDVTIKNLPFEAGQTMTIVAIPLSQAKRFEVNICPNEQDIALHVNPRFKQDKDDHIVIINSRSGSLWGEEHREKGFPFHEGVEVKIIIKFTSGQFTVTLPNGIEFLFPNRFGGEKYSVIQVVGDVQLKGFDIE